jgi:hypothetical protein
LFTDIKTIFWEVIRATLPIIITVFILNLFMAGIPPGQLLQFSIGSVCVVVGMTLFLLGVKIGLLPMGEAIGSNLPGLRILPYIFGIVFLIGFAVTIAEPDVVVLSSQVGTVSQGNIPSSVLLAVIGTGIGFFMCVAILRIILGFPLTYLMAGSYALVLILSFFVPPDFVAVAFDAGGVTTGPLTVPVILSLGIGFSSVLARKSVISDGFGLIGLASVGPIIGVMLMGIITG